MGKWLVPHQDLDPDQKAFLDKIAMDEGNYWINGFAGTGKSILLLYAIKYVAEKHPKASVIVVVYTHSLVDMFKSALSEEGINNIPVMTIKDFNRKKNGFDYVFCDEVQDMPEYVIKAMAEKYKHVYLAGDGNQSIYDYFKTRIVKTDDIEKIISGKKYDLIIVHRLPPSIQRSMQELIPELKKWTLRNLCQNDTPDAQIRICKAKTSVSEIKYVWREAQKAPNVGNTSVILVNSQKAAKNFAQQVLQSIGKPKWEIVKDEYNNYDFDNLNEYLELQGISMRYVGNGFGDFMGSGYVYLMTYYSAKGLDFDDVFLPKVDEYLFKSVEDENHSKRVFMVAMSRCRRNLYISYTGEPHKFISCIPDECSFKINIENALKEKASSAAVDDDLFGI